MINRPDIKYYIGNINKTELHKLKLLIIELLIREDVKKANPFLAYFPKLACQLGSEFTTFDFALQLYNYYEKRVFHRLNESLGLSWAPLGSVVAWCLPAAPTDTKWKTLN